MFIKLSEGEKRKYKKEFRDDMNFVTTNNLMEHQIIADIFKNFKSYMTFRKTCGCSKQVKNYLKLGLYKGNDLFKRSDNNGAKFDG